MIVCNLVAHELHVGDLTDHGRYGADNLMVVDAKITVAQKRSNLALQYTKHTLLGILSEPIVDVLRKKTSPLLKHSAVILYGNTEPCADLSVCVISNRQRLKAVNTVTVQHSQIQFSSELLHQKTGAVYHVILLDFILAHDFGCQFFDCKARLHNTSLLSF